MRILRNLMVIFMGLFDKFTKPKWEHKKWEKRLKAIKELNDQEILSNLAFEDDIPEVRIAAINKITDENILVKHAKNNSNQECRKIAVNNINDDNLLTEIAKMDYTGYRFLDDKTPISLISIAREGDVKNINLTIEVCNLAVDKIKNPTLLTDVAFNAIFVEVRRYSLKYICDENVLVELAIKDEDLLKNIVNKIHTKSSFITLAMNLPSDAKHVFGWDEIVNSIIQNINSDKDLLNISKSAKNSTARGLAIKNLSSINNEDTFIEIAKNDPSSYVRLQCVRKITDEKVLVDFALNDPDDSVRLEAVTNKNLNDIDVLRKVANSDPYYVEIPEYESIDSYKIVGYEKDYVVRDYAKRRLQELQDK